MSELNSAVGENPVGILTVVICSNSDVSFDFGFLNSSWNLKYIKVSFTTAIGVSNTLYKKKPSSVLIFKKSTNQPLTSISNPGLLYNFLRGMVA